MKTKAATKSASLRAKPGTAKFAERTSPRRPGSPQKAARKPGASASPTSDAAKSGTTSTITLNIQNTTGAAIPEFWVGHYSGNTAVPPVTYHFERSDTVGPIANNTTYTLPNQITLYSSSNDQWMFYWRAESTNQLNGLQSQWFTAEVQSKNGTATLLVPPPNGKFCVQQKGKTIKSTTAVTLLNPSISQVITDMFGSATAQAMSIQGMFDNLGVTPPASWGPIGVCLSGGGTRAMTAGMGQLQALATIQYQGEGVQSPASLLSQVRAISSVSGGGWVTAPYLYLNGSTTDADFLNTYVPPNELSFTPSSTPEYIGYLPPNNIGNVCTSGHFSKTSLATQFLGLLWASHIHPKDFADASMIWQTLIGGNVLKPYGLFSTGAGGLPNWTYGYTPAGNTSYGNESIEAFNYYADSLDPSRSTRPFHVCNMSMEVKDVAKNKTFAALVQATPLYAGMFGSNSNVTTVKNSLAVGGGGVSTFGFNSVPTGYMPTGYSPSYYMNVRQVRQWSLADSIGVSSAFLAAGVLEYLKTLSPPEIATLLRTHGPDAMEIIGDLLAEDARRSLEAIMIGPIDPIALGAVAEALYLALKYEGNRTVPKYSYWSPNGFPQNSWPTGFKPNSLVTDFADGGMLENLGLASLLSYTDITGAIVFVNSATPVAATKLGAYDASGNAIANTNIRVDSSIPPLFGYMGYDKKRGYVPFGAPGAPGSLNMANRCAATVQIFPNSAFPALLQGLWNAATNSAPIDASAQFVNPAVYLQQNLPLQNNALFNIAGGRSVNVYWSHLNEASAWTTALPAQIAGELEPKFPHYSTMKTELSVSQFNLLANLSAWSVMTTLTDEVIATLASPPSQST